ncbi:MAG: AAA family ATPase [Oscillospiraceae bacterium]|jgi:type II secretory pathway predicted ATPase ExeA|nr:AAA family ATPase [Oscillospiraceae bacterium]
MITAYWEMQFNPFAKSPAGKYHFESDDFKQASSRLKHLCDTKGIGLFTGNPGTGKTFTMKKFTDTLNPGMFKIFYAPLSSVTVLEFYRSIAIGLGILPPCKKIDLFNVIQERIVSLAKDKRVTPVIICDEGQYLCAKILNDLKIMLNFDMDAENHAVVILAGQVALASTLSMSAHEALAQRILINYTFTGLSKNELNDYINSILKNCGVTQTIFADNALEALWACCSGSPRVVNSLAENCLRIGALKGVKLIDTEIVMLANNELNLV